MFATLRYGREEGDEVECLDQTDKPPNQGQSNPHSACQACRSKKLKCSGEKSRCQRCKNRGYKCVYTNDKSGGQKRKHHAEKDGSRSSAPSKASSSNEMEAHSSESDATSSRRLSRYPPTPSSFRDGEISEMQRRRSQNLQQMGDDQVIRSMMESVADMEGTTMNESSAESDKELFSQLLAPFQTSDDLFAQVLEDSHENSDGGIVGMEDALMNLGNEHDHFTFDQHMASFANSPQFGLAGTPTSQPIFSPATSSRNGHSNKRLSTQAVSIPSCHSSSGYISSETSCQCTATALRILETLAAHSKSGDLGTAEHALYSLKSNIGKCQELAQCSVCGRESGICILLIMLCEKITSAFEEVASSWEHQLEGFRRNTYRAHDTAGSGHGPLWHMDIDRIRVLIGEYQIDTVEERCEVFSALTLLQLNKLSTLMSELRSNALASNWESHLTLLRVTAQRVKTLKEALRRMIGVTATGS